MRAFVDENGVRIPAKLQSVWFSMIRRCYSPKCKAYKGYGAKGVKVCEEWINSKLAFCKWAMANGWREGLQIDKDILGDGKLYSPETCCFVTQLENLKNRAPFTFPERSNFYDYKGEKRTAAYIANDIGMNLHTFNSRIFKGMSIKEIISIPVGGMKARKKAEKLFNYNGKMLPLSEISKISGIKKATIWSRMRYGATLEEAIKPLGRKSPIDHKKKKQKIKEKQILISNSGKKYVFLTSAEGKKYKKYIL